MFKLKRLTQNPKAELKRFWVGLDSELNKEEVGWINYTDLL